MYVRVTSRTRSLMRAAARPLRAMFTFRQYALRTTASTTSLNNYNYIQCLLLLLSSLTQRIYLKGVVVTLNPFPIYLSLLTNIYLTCGTSFMMLLRCKYANPALVFTKNQCRGSRNWEGGIKSFVFIAKAAGIRNL